MSSGSLRASRREAISARMGRPSEERPNSKLCTAPGHFVANAAQSRVTSSVRPVLLNADSSAKVLSARSCIGRILREALSAADDWWYQLWIDANFLFLLASP